MRLTPIALPPILSPHIHAMWVFESDVGLPSDDSRVVVPNGRAKLIIPWRNGLMATCNGISCHHHEGNALLIGLWDTPTVIGSEPKPTVSIGVEFTVTGFCRFFDNPARELTQRIEPIGNVLGAPGDRLVRRVMSANSTQEAVQIVQHFLLQRFRSLSRSGSTVVDEALRLMIASDLRMDVYDLEQRTGYSRRHLATLFKRDIGFAPKRIQSIMVFERMVRALHHHRSVEQLRDDALDLFYDQSHFIRHFKQFAGESPQRFAEMENEFGRIFYR